MPDAIQSLQQALETFAQCHRQAAELMQSVKEEARNPFWLTACNVMDFALKYDALQSKLHAVQTDVIEAMKRCDDKIAEGRVDPGELSGLLPQKESVKEGRAGFLEAVAEYLLTKSKSEKKPD